LARIVFDWKIVQVLHTLSPFSFLDYLLKAKIAFQPILKQKIGLVYFKTGLVATPKVSHRGPSSPLAQERKTCLKPRLDKNYPFLWL